MTLKDFLNSKVRSYEICLIYANHSTVAISWIFEESCSAIPEKYLNWIVKSDEWFMEAITIKDGLKQSLWFHEITIEEKGKERKTPYFKKTTDSAGNEWVDSQDIFQYTDELGPFFNKWYPFIVRKCEQLNYYNNHTSTAYGNPEQKPINHERSGLP